MAASHYRNSSVVDLGFVEKSESWRLLSHLFPSKVGGKPAWLSLNPLPTIEDVSCANCDKPCVFLLQIYAPVEDLDTCFHRTIFIFVCRDPACCSRNSNKNFLVFRSQLRRENDFYSSSPPEESYNPNANYPKAECFGTSLCAVCGSIGPKRCAKCKKASYCSKEHQTVDWKAGHKKSCGPNPTMFFDHTSILIPEYELVMDTENQSESRNYAKTEEEEKKDYDRVVQFTNAATSEDPNVDEDLERMARQETEDDRIFQKFKERIALEPEQVLRYNRGGSPIWVSNESIPSPEDIPKCNCGSTRTFEFQVMPQLLIHLKLDDVEKSIDWGALVVYCCSANCNENSGYQKEFLWKQDFSESDITVPSDD